MVKWDIGEKPDANALIGIFTGSLFLSTHLSQSLEANEFVIYDRFEVKYFIYKTF